MIKKLDRTLRNEIDSGFTISEPVSIGEMQEKINELVDAVNKQQIQLNNHKCRLLDLHSRVAALDDPTYHEDEDSDWYDDPQYREQPADPYAEQRKWIGKICKFRDIDNDNLYYGPLTKIHDTSPYYYECNHKVCYANCEPVKPDDDIIYKGGKDE